MIGKQLGTALFSALLASSYCAAGGIPSAAQEATPPADPSKPKEPPLSLQTTRTISFDTNEGTWVSLDVSPDGKTIVFELLGDIYSIPMAGGEAKPLLTGPAFESQPHFSPDGSRIVFISDRDGAQNIWTSKADGSDLKQITKQTHGDIISPVYTPDGGFILAARDSDVFGARELWLYDVKGGSGIQLTKAKPTPQTRMEDELNVSGPLASPDGRYVYYSQRHGSIPYDSKFPIWQIARRDRQTGEEEAITAAEGSAIRPVLSPDGNTLVFGTRVDEKTGLRVRDLRSGDERWLKIPIDRDEQEGIDTRDVLPGYAFTPDGRAIIVSYDGHIHRLSIDGASDQVIPFTVHVSQAVGPLLNFPERIDQGPVVSRLAQDPKPSPNGAQITYSALAHIYIADGGKSPRRLTKDETPAFQPTWSPDGRFIAYVTWDRTGGALWKAPADGSGAPKRLTSKPAYYSHPVFSPDGGTLIALRASVSDRDNRAREFSLGPAGEPLTDIVAVKAGPSAAASDSIRVIAPAKDRVDPQFTSDPDRIYLSSGRGLVSIRLDGSDERIAVKVTGLSIQGRNEPEPARELRVSPDGRSALALVNHQVRLLSLPAFGGTPPEVNVAAPSESLERLSVNGADSIGWAPDGKSVFWSLGATFFRLPLSAPQKEGTRTKSSATPAPGSSRPNFKPETVSLAVTASRSTPHGDLLLRGARVITMHGDEVLEKGDVLVHDNRITAVGATGTLTVPSGTETIQLDGATIMPGIIDVHAHWMEIRRNVLDLDGWPFLANLAYGVTAGRDPQTFSNDTFAYQDLIDTGQMIGPRTYSTGPGVFHEVNLQSEQDAEDTLQRYKTYYRTNLIKSYEVGNRQQRQWIVEASAKLHMMPTTEGGIDTRLDLTHILDGFSGNEHNMPQVPLYKDIVTLFAQSGTTYTPTLLVNYGGQFGGNFFFTTSPDLHKDAKIRRFFPHGVLDSLTTRMAWVRPDEYIFPQIAAQAAKIVRAGGRVALGGHGVIQGLQCHWEMWALASGGMTNLEVIRSATLFGAEAIGLAQDLGSIEAGKLADLVILNDNPLQDIHNTNSVRLVMKNGQLFQGDDLSEVWPAKNAGSQGWWMRENDELKRAEGLGSH